MTDPEALTRRRRPYAESVRDIIASKEAALAVTTNPHQRITLQDELGRLRRILAEEEAR